MGLETQLGGPWQLHRGIEKKSKVRNLGSKIHYQTKKEGNFILSAGKRDSMYFLFLRVRSQEPKVSKMPRYLS